VYYININSLWCHLQVIKFMLNVVAWCEEVTEKRQKKCRIIAFSNIRWVN